ncbi:MAG: NAD(P)-dependent alcohol dehydrogenase [Acidimicrobiia bacterium]
MKAIVRDEYGDPDVLRIAEIPAPTPAPGEVLVRVHVSSVNTADLDQLLGKPRIARLGTGVTGPRSGRLGLDLAGVVEAVGSEVTRFVAGDRVWADMFSSGTGAFAEYVCAKESSFVPLPQDLSFTDAATIPHSGLLALQGLGVAGGVRSGQRVLINGAGGCVGPFAIQMAKARGAHVTGVDEGPKLDMVQSLGADEVIDYQRDDFSRPGSRFDYILDIAARRTLVAHMRALANNGVYVRVARNLGGFFSAAVFGGLLTGVTSKRLGVFTWKPNREADMAQVAAMVADRSLTPLVDREFTLDSVPEALQYLIEGRARGKLLVDIRN